MSDDFLVVHTVTSKTTAVWWKVLGRDCWISIESRPHYCDRGAFIAKLHVRDRLAVWIDSHDGWPRYYFDWDRMLAELEAWLRKRGQMLDVADQEVAPARPA